MAEGLLKSFSDHLEVYSAGVNPASRVQPQSIVVMNEIGIDISSNVPKHSDSFKDYDFDYVITVCDHAKESCPVFTGNVKNRVHIGFEDPYEAKGSPEFVLNKYREVRDQIKSQLYDFYVKYLKD